MTSHWFVTEPDENLVFEAVDHEDSTLRIIDHGSYGVTVEISGLGSNPDVHSIIIDKSLLLGLCNQFKRHHRGTYRAEPICEKDMVSLRVYNEGR